MERSAMTAAAATSAVVRVRQARATLMLALVVTALVTGIAVGSAALALAALVDSSLPLPMSARRLLLPGAIAIALAVMMVRLWRARRARSLTRVALWLEERVPALEYALVTTLEAPSYVAGPLEAQIARTSWTAEIRRATARALVAPSVALALAVILLALVPREAVSRVGTPRVGDALLGATRVPADGRLVNHLSPLVAVVDPPAYSGEPRQALDEPAGIAALTGSRIELRGRGRDASVEGAVGSRALRAVAHENTWSMTFVMPQRPAAVRLTEGKFARLLVLEPRTDAAPSVTLELPARDTVLRLPRGDIALSAEARDDIGVVSAAFELIISSGSGESFTFRSGVLAPWRGSAPRARLAARVRLDSLRLGPGDVVHLRAVAADGNVVTGPGRGVSETRTLRIARADEYDSVAVEGAAPANAEKSVLSQRMLIMLAEALESRRSRLARFALVAESQRIGGDQTRLRKQVGEIIFARLGDQPAGEHAHGAGEEESAVPDGKLSPDELLRAAEASTGRGAGEALDFAEGESPVVAINRPLLEAYNAMWDASRELDTGDPGRALPHMRMALAAIQRARQAERIYLRGRPPAIVVDISRVRLQGKDAGTPAARRPRPAIADASRARIARFASAVAALGHQPQAAIDSLLLLRVDALDDSPPLAAALATAIDALRSGREATVSLAQVRRAILGDAVSADTLGSWTRWP